MQLDEIFEENSLPSISERTHIPIETLEYLVARNFGALKRVQVLGFISILEREYRVDLDAFREECLRVYSDDSTVKSLIPKHPERHAHWHQKPLIIDMDRVDYMRYVKPIVVLLVVAAVVYGAWYTLASKRLASEANRSNEDASIGFFASVTRPAQEQLQKEENASTTPQASSSRSALSDDEAATSSEANETNEKNETNTTDSAPSVLMSQDANVTPAASNQTTDWEQAVQINAQIAQAPVVESNMSDLNETNLTEGIVSSVAEPNNDSLRQTSIGSTGAMSETNETNETNETHAESQTETEPANDPTAVTSPYQAVTQTAEESTDQETPSKEKEAQGVVLVPRAKVWIGIVDLITKKRRVVTTKKPVPFTEPKGRWLVATGHGRIGLKFGTRTLDFHDSKKHFLLIEKGTVREISHARFQKLNKSKVW
jgi:hypothetical protein